MSLPPSGSKLKGIGKFFGLFAAVAVGFYVLLLLLNWALSPEIQSEKLPVPPEIAEKMQALRSESWEVDPDNPPQNYVAVDYAEGETAAWWPKGQSKVIDQAVANGDLPPVAERVGPEPVVLKGSDGIGEYGGTWMRLGTNNDWGIMSWRLSGSNLVRWSPMGYPIVPHIAKSWSSNEDATEWTFTLRKGVHWSDGHPLTTEDVRFYWEDVELGLDDGRVASWLAPGGVAAEVEIIDDYTFKFKFAKPYGAFLEMLASNVFYKFMMPKHYLLQYHENIGDEEKIEEMRVQMGLSTKKAVWNAVSNTITNPERPTLNPWIARSEQGTPPIYFVRNPYYFAVDEAGNQLPYIDQVMFEVKHPQLIPVAASAGSASMQGRNLSFDNYTLLMEGTDPGGYELLHWFNPSRSAWTLFPNLNRRAFDNDPSSQWKVQYLTDKRFRQALSLAIDRQTIIDSVYHGIGEPAQLDPGRSSPYFNENLLKSYTEFDPERANQLLDEVGLSKRGPDGMRVAEDGTLITFYIDFTSYTGEGPAQFVIDDWRDVGIRAIHRERNRGLWGQERLALKQDFVVWAGESEFIPLLEIRNFVPSNGWSLHAPAYGQWFDNGGTDGTPMQSGFAQEPTAGSAIRKSMDYWNQMLDASTEEERVKLFSKIADLAAEEVWTISIATPPPFLIVKDKNLKNVPDKAVYGAPYNSPANTAIDTYYFENLEENPAVTAQVANVMAGPLPSKFTLGSEGRVLETSFTEKLSKMVPWLWTICLIGFLIMMATKHPYVARRLLIMVPTLFIVSIIVFIVIQMPPGNFVETKIIQLQMDGDEEAIEQVEQLTELFNLQDPVWKQYIKWSGLQWFVTYDAGDKGLLQGELGISMQTLRSVNDTVEERALLTMAISLLTVLFTWAVALPIGIYTAVRQYSIGDYALTFIGFIGMCVPNFLLAILMMYWANKYFGINVTGLFSPEYATDPSWSWGKFVDLLLHLIVPIIVIGTAGTAGMIRVMRANLLDELRKPYVTTAMAKGVKPFKLLIKYPVRLAINPFISGIGGLFPSMLSGGSITAIILALPMIGPLLLDGLLTEDFYLAGSLLMVFSLLGIAGTLVSDILLLLVDPRIRMDGGSK